jgi:Ala-tRNA(Pro) deacylase
MSDDSQDIHVRLCELLDRRGAVYRVVEHEPEGRTEYIARVRGNKPEQAIKSIVVQVRFGEKESRYYLANVPGHCRVDLMAVQSILNGTDASIAPRPMAELLTGCVIGAIPPFSFKDRLLLLADPLIRSNEEVVFNAGRLDRSIFMKSTDYFLIAAPRLANIADQVKR